MKFHLLVHWIVLLYLPVHVTCFYFFTNGAERKCFHKELSKDTLLQGRYKIQSYDDQLNAYNDAKYSELGIIIDVEEVFDNNHRVVHQRGSSAGDFTFIALDSGEHKICLQPQPQGWLAKIKTKIDIEFEIGSEDKIDSKKKSTMQSLHHKVQILNSRVQEIKREQDLMRRREATFRDASESANSRAMWWSIITVIILGITCLWQLSHLRTFFVKQKVL